MATRIEQIISAARVTLADKDAQRWSDDDLLLLINEAHQDFATETELLSGRVQIPLTIGDPYFTLPDDVYLVTRVLWGDTLLPIVSHTELDRHAILHKLSDFDIYTSDTWETDEGEPQAFIYDRRNMSEGKVYPIPDESIITSSYTFEDRGEFVGDGRLGVTVAIDDYTANSVYGVIGDIYEPDVQLELFNSVYGVLAGVSETTGVIHIYYVKVPDDLVTVEDSLATPPLFDKALKYYTIGHAFLNDIDTEYQAKGTQQLQLYERELLKAKHVEQRDGTRAGQMSTDYRKVI